MTNHEETLRGKYRDAVVFEGLSEYSNKQADWWLERSIPKSKVKEVVEGMSIQFQEQDTKENTWHKMGYNQALDDLLAFLNSDQK